MDASSLKYTVSFVKNTFLCSYPFPGQSSSWGTRPPVLQQQAHFMIHKLVTHKAWPKYTQCLRSYALIYFQDMGYKK